MGMGEGFVHEIRFNILCIVVSYEFVRIIPSGVIVYKNIEVDDLTIDPVYCPSCLHLSVLVFQIQKTSQDKSMRCYDHDQERNRTYQDSCKKSLFAEVHLILTMYFATLTSFYFALVMINCPAFKVACFDSLFLLYCYGLRYVDFERGSCG